MFSKYAPVMAAFIMLFTGPGIAPGLAQLPPTNMGKFVHQPGDNQYTDQTQSERHGVPGYRPDLTGRPIIQAPAVQYVLPPTPPPKRPDISIEPIASDEPIPPAGFPPLPDRLDLPIANANGWKTSGSFSNDSGSGGGSGGGSSGPPAPTFHQHYGHVPPGAYLNPQQKANPQGAGGGSSDASPGLGGGGGGGGGGGHGYYKAQTPPPIQKQGSGYYKARTPGGSPGGGDYFNANTAGGPTAPRYTGASAKDLKALGREPKLNDRQEDTGAPDAPQPVTVNQSTTQDLSLPEDEFSYKANQPNKAGRSAARTMTRMIKAPLNSVGGMAGLRF